MRVIAWRGPGSWDQLFGDRDPFDTGLGPAVQTRFRAWVARSA